MSKSLIRLLLALVGGGLSPGVASAQTENVQWTNASGVSVSGNSLSKTASTAWGNSGASSLQSLESAGFVEFVATETNTWRLLGLSKGDTDQNYPDIDFGLGLGYDDLVYVLEQGTALGSFGSYSTGDRFRIEVGGGVVRYRKNGGVFYTSSVSPRFPLLVDAALYDSGATLSTVEIGRGSFVADTGLTVTGRTLTKTSGSGWNAGAVSAQKILWGDASVEFTANETDKRRAAGLSGGDSGTDVSDIDFALVLKADATVEIQEGGTSRGGFGSYATNDRFRVEAVGGTVKYYRNGVSLYTSTLAPSYPLLVDTAFDTTGSTLADVVVSDVVWSLTSGVSLEGNSLRKTGTSGWNAGAVSTASLASGDGFVEFTATETNTGRMCGLGTSDSGPSDGDIEFAVQLTSGGDVKVYESGTLRGTYGTYASGDRFRVELRDGTVRYRKNGATFYTSTVTPSYPLTVDSSLYTPGATLSEVLLGNLVWKNEAGLVVRGYGLAKTTGSAAWGDSGAATNAAISSGDGFVEFTATELTTWRMVGLSNGDANQNYTDIDFGLGLGFDDGIHVYEQGTLRGDFGSYASGDRLRVGVEGGAVKYRKNGTLLYTSTVTPSYPLLVDTSFYDASATVSEVYLATTAESVATPTLSPSGGSYTAPVSVQISCATAGATIHYTTNGVDPTTSDPTITSGDSFTVDQNRTLKARAFKTGYVDSGVATGVYTLYVPAPTLNPIPWYYDTPQNVTVSSSLSGVTIHYTTNGQDPTESDPTVTSGGTVLVDANLILKVRAWKTGWSPSVIVGGAYYMTVAPPTLTPSTGAYSSTQTVTFSTITPGATLRYTTDGREPTSSDPSGTSVTVDRSMTVKVSGMKTGWTSSTTAASYVLTLGTAATPTFSPAAGTYSSSQSITISTATSGATIRYTVDGTTPTFASPVYTGAVTVAVSSTLKARAFKTDNAPSAAATADYIIDGTRVALPAIGPGSGRFASGQQVTISSLTTGATIRYTTNGLDPTETDTAISSGSSILVGRSLRVKAKAWKTGLTPSAVAVADYDVVGNVAAGAMHTLVLKSDGTVWAFGNNDYGQLGDTTWQERRTPVQVSGLTDVVAIASGAAHSLAIKSDTSLWAWGFNGSGQIGDGTATNRNQPVQVLTGGSPLTGVVAIGAGWGHSVALKADGTVYVWGYDAATGGAYSYQAVPIANLTGISAIAAGGYHTLALKTDGTGVGTLWALGHNGYGQLGDATTVHRPSPISVLGNVAAIFAGAYHSLAIKSDGSIVGMGMNERGQLGDGTTTLRTSPQAAFLTTGVKQLSAGGYHTLALKPDGTLWGSGYNITGELGDGTFDQRTTPVQTALLEDVVAMAAGRVIPSIYTAANSHSVALTADGRIWTWGSNYYGQLGDGTTAGDTKLNPRPLQGFTASDRTWPAGDPDADGLSTELELQIGSNPFAADTNGDGISDGAAYRGGLSPTNTDMDGDGVLNATEIAQGTDPFRTDSDGDGTGDSTDCFPLDPTRWQCPSANPNDHTPPAITLTEPTNATLVSSTP